MAQEGQMKLENEKNIKLILAIWIILSHLPGMKVLGAYNYLPVAGFFFLSGYGLMMKSKSNSKYNLLKSILKIYIPYMVATIIYTIIFNNYNLLMLLKQITLIKVDLPYGWYIRTQIILYIIWFIANNSKNKNWKIFISFVLVLIYSILFRYTGQILTSYKTVFAFVVGLWYAMYENKVFKYINLYSCVFCGVVSLAIRFIVTDNETIFDSVLYNLSGILFCFLLVYSIYKINIKNKKIDFLKNMSLELYLVQGISQCFFMKTYFCDKSFLYLNNNLLIIILSTIGTIILGYLLKKIDTKIFNIIYKRKEA